MSKGYGGKRSYSARKIVRAHGSGPCIRCGKWTDVNLHKWEADHLVSRTQAEAMGWTKAEQDSPQNLGIAHASCNHKAGATLGNKLRAKPRIEQRRITPIKRTISFLGEHDGSPGSAPHVFYPAADSTTPEGTE